MDNGLPLPFSVYPDLSSYSLALLPSQKREAWDIYPLLWPTGYSTCSQAEVLPIHPHDSLLSVTSKHVYDKQQHYLTLAWPRTPRSASASNRVVCSGSHSPIPTAPNETKPVAMLFVSHHLTQSRCHQRRLAKARSGVFSPAIAQASKHEKDEKGQQEKSKERKNPEVFMIEPLVEVESVACGTVFNTNPVLSSLYTEAVLNR